MLTVSCRRSGLQMPELQRASSDLFGALCTDDAVQGAFRDFIGLESKLLLRVDVRLILPVKRLLQLSHDCRVSPCEIRGLAPRLRLTSHGNDRRQGNRRAIVKENRDHDSSNAPDEMRTTLQESL